MNHKTPTMAGAMEADAENPAASHIVLLGEGDLSFARALGLQRFEGRVTATELRKPADVRDDYFGGSDDRLAELCDEVIDVVVLERQRETLPAEPNAHAHRIVRELFRVAEENAPSIVFIDEIDAVGTKRYDSHSGGEKEIQRTMLELLNQLDGFDSRGDVKVIMATNRIESLDTALIRHSTPPSLGEVRSLWLIGVVGWNLWVYGPMAV